MKINIVVKIIFTIILSFATICLIFILIEYPRYLDLPLPSPNSQAPRGDWNPKIHMITTYTDAYFKSFVLRKQSGVADNLDTKESVMNYFDERLVKLGWVKNPENEVHTCLHGFDEKEFINDTNGLYQEYVRKGSNFDDPYWYPSEVVCVAVLEFNFTDWKSFRAILITEQASPFTKFIKSFD